MRVAPIPVKHAVRFVERVHRRLKHAHHRMWAIGLWDGGDLRGVALVGSRHVKEKPLQDKREKVRAARAKAEAAKVEASDG